MPNSDWGLFTLRVPKSVFMLSKVWISTKVENPNYQPLVARFSRAFSGAILFLIIPFFYTLIGSWMSFAKPKH